jgi:hypothetical protein
MKYKVLLLSPIFFLACNLDHSLGNADQEPDAGLAGADATKASTSPSPDASPTSTSPATTDAQSPSQTSAAQSWTGYVENFKFGSGSDSLKLIFTPDISGQVTGTVTFGNGIAPPPATDPNVGYPPGMNTTTTMPNEYLEGSTFTIRSGSLQSNRLRFTIDPIELWSGWCALQPAPTDGSDICTPEVFYSFESDATHTACVLHPTANESVPFNCVKWDLCMMSRVCACSPTGCVANYEESGYKLSFDVFLPSGSGSMSGTVFGSDHNVHFTQD